MPRSLSTTLQEAVNVAATDEVFLALLTLSRPSMSTPIRVVRNTEAVTSNGDTYEAYPFDFTFAGQNPQSATRASLSIDNISPEIMIAVRAERSPITVSIQIVLASDPDAVEIDVPALTLRRVNYDAARIHGELDLGNDPTTEPAVPVRVMPSTMPGLFSGVQVT